MYEYNSDFKMVQSRLLKEVDGFLHDFAVTENYYVFLSVSPSRLWRCTVILSFCFSKKAWYTFSTVPLSIYEVVSN